MSRGSQMEFGLRTDYRDWFCVDTVFRLRRMRSWVQFAALDTLCIRQGSGS